MAVIITEFPMLLALNVPWFVNAPPIVRVPLLCEKLPTVIEISEDEIRLVHVFITPKVLPKDIVDMIVVPVPLIVWRAVPEKIVVLPDEAVNVPLLIKFPLIVNCQKFWVKLAPALIVRDPEIVGELVELIDFVPEPLIIKL